MRFAHFTASGFALFSLLLPLAVITFVIWLLIRSYGMINFPDLPGGVSQETSNPLWQKDKTHSRARLSAKEMARLNLFGEAKNTEVVTRATEDIPITKLQLVLIGAFTSTTFESSSALIATSDRTPAERFFVGEEVPGNAVLEEVYPAYVVLKRGGRLEKLLLPREQDQQVASNRAPANTHSNPGVAVNPNDSSQEDAQDNLPKQEQGAENIRDRLQRLRKQLTPQEL